MDQLNHPPAKASTCFAFVFRPLRRSAVWLADTWGLELVDVDVGLVDPVAEMKGARMDGWWYIIRDRGFRGAF